MPDLLDILGTPKTVKYNGAELPVYGVSIEGIAALLRRFPVLQDMIKAGQAIELPKEITPAMLIQYGPDCAGAVIAAALGYPGSDKHEVAARRLPVNTQLEILAVAKELTMPDGLGPFVESWKRLGLAEVEQTDDNAADVASGKPQATAPAQNGSGSAGPVSSLPRQLKPLPVNTAGQSNKQPS